MQLRIVLITLIFVVGAFAALTLGVLYMKKRDRSGSPSNSGSDSEYGDGFDGSDLGSPLWFGDGGWDGCDAGGDGGGDGGGD